MKESKVFQLFANAKINRLLRVVRKRSDGFRDLRLEFFSIELADKILALPSGDGSVEFFQPNANLRFAENFKRFEKRIDIPIRNTVSRAIELFEKITGLKCGYSFKVLKRIPDGAGLGGGSSDAAACLLFLNNQHGKPLNSERLAELALEIGSDVPFFLDPIPGIYTGRGEERVKAIPISTIEIGLICPDFSVSTAEAFAQLPDESYGEGEDLDVTKPFFSFPPEVNAFWHDKHPNFAKLAEIRTALLNHGASSVYMSGSGSVQYFPLSKNFDKENFLIKFPNTRLILTRIIE